jgi:multidrug transporter EmrE-like cation transporter
MKILAGVLWGVAAQVLTFLQLQGQLKYSFIKNNVWAGVLLGIPISYMFMKSVKSFVEAYDGQIWPSRLIGFGIGVIVFTLMSHYLFREPLTAKTLTCLFLGVCIIFIQLFW